MRAPVRVLLYKCPLFVLSFHCGRRPREEVPLKPGIATISLRKYDVFHAIDLAAGAGFRGVEIWGRPPHTPDEFDEEHTRRVLERVRNNGLKVSMFGSYVNTSAPDYEQKSIDAIRIAKGLCTRRIRVWAGNREPGEADEELWKHTARTMHEFALRAEDEGFTLAIEMHGGTLCATVEGCLRVLEETNSPNLKLNYQVYNCADPDVDRVLGLIGAHVVNVHAQNYRPSRVDPAKMELCLIREGAVDYDRVLSLLSGHGFKGFVEVEFLKGEFVSDEAMMESLKQDALYLTELTSKYSA